MSKKGKKEKEPEAEEVVIPSAMQLVFEQCIDDPNAPITQEKQNKLIELLQLPQWYSSDIMKNEIIIHFLKLCKKEEIDFDQAQILLTRINHIFYQFQNCKELSKENCFESMKNELILDSQTLLNPVIEDTSNKKKGKTKAKSKKDDNAEDDTPPKMIIAESQIDKILSFLNEKIFNQFDLYRLALYHSNLQNEYLNQFKQHFKEGDSIRFLPNSAFSMQNEKNKEQASETENKDATNENVDSSNNNETNNDDNDIFIIERICDNYIVIHKKTDQPISNEIETLVEETTKKGKKSNKKTKEDKEKEKEKAAEDASEAVGAASENLKYPEYYVSCDHLKFIYSIESNENVINENESKQSEENLPNNTGNAEASKEEQEQVQEQQQQAPASADPNEKDENKQIDEQQNEIDKLVNAKLDRVRKEFEQKLQDNRMQFEQLLKYQNEK